MFVVYSASILLFPPGWSPNLVSVYVLDDDAIVVIVVVVALVGFSS